LKEDDSSKVADTDTEQKLQELKVKLDKNKEAVIQKIMETIVRVDPKIHENYKF
jgi:hypothetical protein